MMRLDGLGDAEPERRRRPTSGEAGKAFAQTCRQNAAVGGAPRSAPGKRAQDDEEAQDAADGDLTSKA